MASHGEAHALAARGPPLLFPGDPSDELHVAPRIVGVLERREIGHANLEQPPQLAGGPDPVHERARRRRERRRLRHLAGGSPRGGLDVRGDRDQVVLGQLFYCGFHRSGQIAITGALLHVVELTREVAR